MGFNKITNGWFAAGVLDQRWTSNIAEVDITTALGRRLVVDFWWTLKIRSPGAGIFRWRGGRSLHYPRGQPGLRWELALFGRLLLPLKRWHSCFRLCRSWADWGMDTINPSQEFIELLRKSWEISVQRGPFSRGIYRHPPSDLSYLPVNKRIPCVVSHPVCSDLFSQSTIFHVQNHATSFAYEFLLKMVEQKPYFRGFPIAGSHKKNQQFSPAFSPAGQEDVEAQIQAEHDARLAAEEVLLIGFLLGTSILRKIGRSLVFRVPFVCLVVFYCLMFIFIYVPC